MKLVSYCNKLIEYSFYGIFFFVPLLFTQHTSELFELNKIWILYGFTIVILTAWLSKMVIEKEFRIQRSIFDIPLGLFLLSQILATLFSLDQHISFYGYYSRFNGGLLSTIVFIFLYYAFISNLTLKEVFRSLFVIVSTGVIVALWGLPSHFGNDPTCLLFRGTFDTSCWTDAFHPTIRIFSTLGQPAWLAAYLAFLIPIAIFYSLLHEKDSDDEKASSLWFWTFVTVSALFFVDLIFANTRAGYIGFLFGYIALWAFVFFRQLAKKKKMILGALFVLANSVLLFATLKSAYWSMHLIVILFVIIAFFLKRQYVKTFIAINLLFLVLMVIFGSPIGRLHEPFTKLFPAKAPVAATQTPQPAAQPVGTVLETNITDSGDIRKIVWQGAIDIWKSSPVFGTGVETYAFAYYKHRPPAHNVTSEWDYLYNKAHNEYLNYLATTGLFGLGTYILLIGTVVFVVGRLFLSLFKTPASKQKEHEGYVPTKNYLAVVATSAGFITILISNFFGFSVVIINLFFFLTPALLLILLDLPQKSFSMTFSKNTSNRVSLTQWSIISVLLIIMLWLFLNLIRTWNADKAYALGYNLARVGDIQNSYFKLHEAVNLRPAEPVFRNEYAVVNATIGSALLEQQDATNAAQFVNQAVALSNDLTTKYPNNILFLKDRFKIFFILASAPSGQQPVFRQEAIQALERARQLAPTDAKLLYNLGILYKESGDPKKAIGSLEQAVALKPDYRDAYYALGLSYREAALSPNGGISDPAMQQKAVETMQLIIQKFGKDSGEAQKSLTDWGVQVVPTAAQTPN